jgi:hypothetical protein
VSNKKGVQDAIKLGNSLHQKRTGLLSFWQEVMANFAPASANFMGEDPLTQDYASDLATSFPPLVARDLMDHFAAMLRPVGVPYSEMYVEDLKDQEALGWLQWASGVMHRIKRDRRAMFDAAMKEGDRDLSLLGNAVLDVNARPDKSGLLYRAFHLKDVAWQDDMSGMTEVVDRKWTPTLATLVRLFGVESLSPENQSAWRTGDNPYKEIPCRHIILPPEQFHGETKYRTPFVSVHCEENGHELECLGIRKMPYVIPRWRRIKGIQYAVSPAVEVALPEGRLLQAMVLTLLEAAEKSVNPPMLAIESVIRPDMDTRAGSVIWRAQAHDDKTGLPLQPIINDKSGLGFGMDMQARSEMMLRNAFYLDKLMLPVRDGTQMTAYEFARRTEQYIRGVTHLFSPIESEYTEAIDERTFDEAAANGAFGPPETWPKSLRGADIRFRFRNPISDAADQAKAEQLREAIELAQAAATIDQNAPLVIDIKPALRDALIARRTPVAWLRPPEQIEAAEAAQDEEEQQAQMLAAANSASQTAANLAKVE